MRCPGCIAIAAIGLGCNGVKGNENKDNLGLEKWPSRICGKKLNIYGFRQRAIDVLLFVQSYRLLLGIFRNVDICGPYHTLYIFRSKAA